MKILKIIAVLFFFAVGSVSGQNDCGIKQMITKIDSISKSQNVRFARVKILYITNTFDKTDTDQRNLTQARRFSFDGQFLLIDKKYFNMNKLLYFYIDNGVLELFFQAY